MPVPTTSTGHSRYIRPGFQWDGCDAYLFDIDGTLLNSRDAVHYHAFQNAVRSVCGFDAGIDGLPVHGSTDPRILRAALDRAGVEEQQIAARLPSIIEQMCAEVSRNFADLAPELCPAIPDLLAYLQRKGKLLAAASGNVTAIGWAKLEKAGLKSLFAFGAFSWPREAREEIFAYGAALARERHAASICVVGDTPADIKAARELGIAVIALATGIYSYAQLLACSPDVCVECAPDLLALST